MFGGGNSCNPSADDNARVATTRGSGCFLSGQFILIHELSVIAQAFFLLRPPSVRLHAPRQARRQQRWPHIRRRPLYSAPNRRAIAPKDAAVWRNLRANLRLHCVSFSRP
jgi:hypothetical protein